MVHDRPKNKSSQTSNAKSNLRSMSDELFPVSLKKGSLLIKSAASYFVREQFRMLSTIPVNKAIDRTWCEVCVSLRSPFQVERKESFGAHYRVQNTQI